MIVIGRDTENPDQSNLQCFGPQHSVERAHTHFHCSSIFSCLSSSHTLFFSHCVSSLSLSLSFCTHTHISSSLALTHQAYHSLSVTVLIFLSLFFSRTLSQASHSYRSVSVNVSLSLSLSSTHTLFLSVTSHFLYTRFVPGQLCIPHLFLPHTHQLCNKTCCSMRPYPLPPTQGAIIFGLLTQMYNLKLHPTSALLECLLSNQIRGTNGSNLTVIMIFLVFYYTINISFFLVGFLKQVAECFLYFGTALASGACL